MRKTMLLAGLAAFVSAHVAQAQPKPKDELGCIRQNSACISVRSCLLWPQADPNDTSRIKSGNGRLVADGGSACAINHDNHAHGQHYKDNWDRDTLGCLDPGYLQASKDAIAGACGRKKPKGHKS